MMVQWLPHDAGDWLVFGLAALGILHFVSLLHLGEIVRRLKAGVASGRIADTGYADLPSNMFSGFSKDRARLYAFIFFGSLRWLKPAERMWVRVSRLSIALFFTGAIFWLVKS